MPVTDDGLFVTLANSHLCLLLMSDFHVVLVEFQSGLYRLS
jgi:hypothetical protein